MMQSTAGPETEAIRPTSVTSISDTSLRVALLLESDGPGGAERMLLHLAEELRHRGHWVCPVGPDNGCGWLAEQFRAQGFDPATYSLRRQMDWRCLRTLVQLFRRHEIDLVHSHDFTMAVYGAAAALVRRIPHIVTMHGGHHYAGRWRRRAALRWAFNHSRSVIAVSSATQVHLQRTLRLQPGAVDVIRNGIDFEPGDRESVRRELGVADHEVLIVAVGNLYSVKGHIVLLRALAEVEAAGSTTPWRLAIAGRGEEEGALRTFLRERNLSGRAVLLGYRQDIPNILAAADIYVMPSLSEGLPVALLEAMLSGKAIVASDVGGIPEAIAAGTDGLLTPPGDHQALAVALLRLIENSNYRATLGQSGQRRATRHFSVERMTESYERLYNAAVGRAP